MRIGVGLWISLAAACLAAEPEIEFETVAWRVPVELVVDGGLENGGVSRLEKPPGESVFFEAGDELWDLSGVIEQRVEAPGASGEPDPFAQPDPATEVGRLPFTGAFAVWNARSQMIVARGTVAQLSVVDGAMDLDNRPVQVRLTADVKEGRRSSELVVSVRSGETGMAAAEGLRLEAASHLSDDRSLADVQFDLTVPQAGGPRSIKTATTLKTGERQVIARWADETSACEVGLTAQVVLSWDVACDEVRVVERNGRQVGEPNADLTELDGRSVGDGLVIRVFFMPPDFFQRIEDPAAIFERLQVPDALAGLLPPDLIDARRGLEANGVKFSGPLAVAGYESKRSQLVVVNDRANQDFVEAILLGCISGPVTLEIQFEGEWGYIALVGRSGESWSITSQAGEVSTPLLEVSPNLGANGKLIDIAYFLRLPEGEFELTAASTLVTGKPVQVASYSSEGGENTITLTATVRDRGDDR